MGIIKLKNVNEEQTKNVAVDEKSVYNRTSNFLGSISVSRLKVF